VGRSEIAPDAVSDDALLAAMALGDEQAALAFVRRYQRRVFGLAVGMVGDRGLAEDISQEALTRAWRHAPVFDARRGSVATWVLTITRNLSIDALRLRRAEPTDPDDLVGLKVASTERAPEEAAEAAESAGELRVALGALPPEQARALVLASIYGRTAAEISESESIPLGTAKTRIRAGLAKMRAAMTAREGPS
jgi:RNA polymerase sigma factor (sigma-70 family)